MRDLNTKMSYPFFLGPEEHCLEAHYRRLNRWFFILSPLVFVINEFFIRSHLSVYKETPDMLWSLLALALNAQIPIQQGIEVFMPIVVYAACLAINFSMLPKWGPRPSKVGLKSGLPTDDGYKSAYFSISNTFEKMAFLFWNSILVRISFFFASFIPCMAINLLRSL